MITAENRAVGGIYVAGAVLAAVLAGPFVLYALSEGRIMRAREVVSAIGPMHIWIAATLISGAAFGAVAGSDRVFALGRRLAAPEPGRAWVTVGLWAALIAITVVTTALYAYV